MGVRRADLGPRRAAARGVSARDALRVDERADLVVRHQDAVDASARHGDRRVGERAARVVRQRLRDAHAAVRVSGVAQGHWVVERLRADAAGDGLQGAAALGALVLKFFDQALALRRRARCRVFHLLARLVEGCALLPQPSRRR